MSYCKTCGLLLLFLVCTLFAGSEQYDYQVISEGKVTLLKISSEFLYASEGYEWTENVYKYKIRDAEGNLHDFSIRNLSMLLSDNPESMRLLKKQKRRYILMICLSPLIVPVFLYEVVIPEIKSYMIEAVKVYNR